MATVRGVRGRRCSPMLAARGSARSPRWRTSCGGRSSARPSAGRWPAPGRSTRSRATAGRRCGASRPSTGATTCSGRPRRPEEEALSPLERMTLLERLQADYAHLSLTTGAHPMRLVRPLCRTSCPPGSSGRAAGRAGEDLRLGHHAPAAGDGEGVLLHHAGGRDRARERDRPAAALRGVPAVINLEPALVITGRLQNEKGVIHVMAEEIAGMPDLGLPAQGVARLGAASSFPPTGWRPRRRCRPRTGRPGQRLGPGLRLPVLALHGTGSTAATAPSGSTAS
jgi:hypothetical protein